jgi:septum formation protein
MHKSNKIILGSQSPRRFEILADAGFDIKVVKPTIEERYPFDLDYYKVPEYISKLKIFDIYSYLGEDDDVIICADTMVIFDNKLVGKPKNADHAFRILKAMNGKPHDVVTGVSMRRNKKQISFSEQTKVRFKELTDDEIKNYIDKFEPYDKAGSYNIQEYIGVDYIVGEYQNVMGLPIKRVLLEMKSLK